MCSLCSTLQPRHCSFPQGRIWPCTALKNNEIGRKVRGHWYVDNKDWNHCLCHTLHLRVFNVDWALPSPAWLYLSMNSSAVFLISLSILSQHYEKQNAELVLWLWNKIRISESYIKAILLRSHNINLVFCYSWCWNNSISRGLVHREQTAATSTSGAHKQIRFWIFSENNYNQEDLKHWKFTSGRSLTKQIRLEVHYFFLYRRENLNLIFIRLNRI